MLLGLQSLQDLGFSKPRFVYIGCLPGEYSIHVDSMVPPVVHPPRPIPIAHKEKFKAELDSLET